MIAMEKNEPLLIAFGRKVRERREANRISQEKLAEAAELDRTYISDIERGVRNISIINIYRIARALGVSVADLTQGIDT